MYSGGLGSFFCAYHLIFEEHIDPANMILLFADTKMEDEDLYRFLDESEKVLNLPVTRIADGRNPWQVHTDVKFLGNTRIDPCSRVLKRTFMDDWISNRFAPDQVRCYIGIDKAEEHRIKTLAERKLPYIYSAPLCDAGVWLTRSEKISRCENLGLRPPRLYAHGFEHNNCGGFCVKAGQKQFRLLWEKFPERYEWHVQQERKFREAVPNGRPFLRKQIDGKTHYLWLEDFRRDYLETGSQASDEARADSQLGTTHDPTMTFGGCGCAID